MKLRAAAALRLTLVLLFVAPALGAADKPSLVVVISVDQMRADYLDRFRPWFGEDGFNRFLQRGRAIHAGAPAPRHDLHRPRARLDRHGPRSARSRDHRQPLVRQARRPDASTASRIRAVKWIGAPDGAPQIPIAPASPVNLDATSLGDRLKERFPGARVIGLALKDRAAVLMAGRKADAALWFEERFERFVTSSYYPPLPRCSRSTTACPRSSPRPSIGPGSSPGAFPRRTSIASTFGHGRGSGRDGSARRLRGHVPARARQPQSDRLVPLGRRPRPPARTLHHRIAAARVARRPARPPVRRALFDRLLRTLVRTRLEGDRRRHRPSRRVARGLLRVGSTTGSGAIGS